MRLHGNAHMGTPVTLSLGSGGAKASEQTES